ncbi:hypothetical protein CYMTET_45449 [Cymbomonas tetramitiformis]|uniref:Uncharacterized protein n=1 Tax=Cymbomonas tetramitiformis TaxID=36881 RepID=A0AAE0BZH7_9CHLO|nr:hypothetical protein CYMTET_45449 [Cymbomonas tetramitiformis]
MGIATNYSYRRAVETLVLKAARPVIDESDDESDAVNTYDYSDEDEDDEADEEYALLARAVPRRRAGKQPVARKITKSAAKSAVNGKESMQMYHEFSRLGEDLPLVEFHKGADYLDVVLTYFACVYEQGDEEGVNKQSPWNIVVKYLTYNNKVYSRLGMIGYCHANVARLVDKVVRNKNVSGKDIKAGLDTYLLYMAVRS